MDEENVSVSRVLLGTDLKQLKCHTLFLIIAKMGLPKSSAPYWSTHPLFFFDIWALWRSALSARVPECQQVKKDGLDQYGPVHFEV